MTAHDGYHPHALGTAGADTRDDRCNGARRDGALNSPARSEHGARFRFACVASAPDAQLPQRATPQSAGYDFVPYLVAPITIDPGAVQMLRTGVKAYMPPGWVLLIVVRSSVGIKRRLIIPNSVGVIDADYADNPTNDGEIFLALWNIGTQPQTITPTDRLAQGLFVPHGVTADEAIHPIRTGGIGSTTSAHPFPDHPARS